MTRPTLPDAALELWRFTAPAAMCVPVFPDGCRDLIVSIAPAAAPVCFVSALADGAETPAFVAGQHTVGVRMRAGAQFDETTLLAQLARLVRGDRLDDADLLAAIGATVRIDARVDEALACLAQLPRLDAARARLGVSERALERLLRERTGRAPLFWKNLARARRCARAVVAEDAASGGLSDIAAEHGYADQAHMTRDLRRWFGAAPSRMRLEPQRFATLVAVGHG